MVGAALPTHPAVEGFLGLVSAGVGESAVCGEKNFGFRESPAPSGSGVIGVPGGKSCFMSGAQPGLVVFAGLEVPVNCVAFPLTPIGYFTHG